MLITGWDYPTLAATPQTFTELYLMINAEFNRKQREDAEMRRAMGSTGGANR